MASRLEKDYRALTGQDIDGVFYNDEAGAASARLLILIAEELRQIRETVERLERSAV